MPLENMKIRNHHNIAPYVSYRALHFVGENYSVISQEPSSKATDTASSSLPDIETWKLVHHEGNYDRGTSAHHAQTVFRHIHTYSDSVQTVFQTVITQIRTQVHLSLHDQVHFSET